jgi:acyl transferase domain-containing protein/thioesterase domain-containing protein/SAM-dependent methyltransferase
MDDDEKIAIIGLSCRFPGARNAAEYWANLRAGRESVSRFTRAALAAAGVPRAQYADPAYVPARAVVAGADRFDAELFGYSPAEAGRIDPQHRVFLESAASALDDAALDPARFSGPVGVFAGCDAPAPPDPDAYPDTTALQLGYDKDHLAPRVAYKLGLRGPSLTVQATCATTLAAVHLACQSLLGYECDAALAGGVAIWLPEAVGYLYQDGHILSPDGRCRPFDAAASGTVPGNGVGTLVLKRLTDALREGDRILAVIRGSAVNNDGGERVGYTAPTIAGQREVILSALARADVDAADLGYVEGHGTGTRLGDPVEVAALTAAFREHTDALGSCLLGSVKGNIGHTSSAAGAAGLIKAAFMLAHRELVPSINFERPNPELDLDSSPFRICTAPGPWPGEGARLAGVSAFGLGGNNAHVVLESAPERRRPVPRPGPRALLISAASPEALATSRAELAQALASDPSQPLDEAAWTLATGRRRYPYRTTVVASDPSTAAAALRLPPAPVAPPVRSAPEVAFLFPGQGTLREGAGAAAYAELPAFREAFDHVGELALAGGGPDLSPVLDRATAPEWFRDTVHQQLGLFALGYALARHLIAVGVRPAAMLGHSIGEYTAATIAEVWQLGDAVRLVRARAAAMGEAEPGLMLAVAAGALGPQPAPGVHVAVDGPARTVLAGAPAAIEELRDRLAERGIAAQVLHTAHAFHTPAMARAAQAVREAVAGTAWRKAEIPFVANLTGTWADPSQGADADYWAEQLSRPVLLSAGVGTLLAGRSRLLLELGPGHSMAAAVRAHPGWSEERSVVGLLGRDRAREPESIVRAHAACWERGVPLDDAVWAPPRQPKPLRRSLPPHPLRDTLRKTATASARIARTEAPAGAREEGLTALAWREDPGVGGARFAEPRLVGAFDDAMRELARQWSAPEADLAGAAFVAVPDSCDAEWIDGADRIEAARIVLFGRRLVEVFDTSPDAGLLSWIEHRRRSAPGGACLVDLGEGTPPRPPVLREDVAVYAWRGGRWWARTAMPLPDSGPATPLPAITVAAATPGPADLLAASGIAVTGFLGPHADPIDPAELAALAQDGTAQAHRATLSTRPDVAAALDAFGTALVGQAVVRRAGLEPGERIGAADLRSRLTPGGRLLRFVDSILGMLTADGWLRADGSDLILAQDVSARIGTGAAAGEKLTHTAGLRRLLEHCVAALPEVLDGAREPVSVLYPDGSENFLHSALADNAIEPDDAEPCLDALVRAVRAFAARADRPVRILEVGGGRGVFTGKLLDAQPDRDRVPGYDYHFTDISPLLVRQAEERGVPGLRASVFDISGDPVAQGLVPGSYDIVIGYNVVHVAPSVPNAVGTLARLLRPGGWLGLVELVRPARWTHLVWGFAPGWWDFADGLRTDSIHLDLDQWRAVLEQARLDPAVVACGPEAADHALLLAGRPTGHHSVPGEHTDDPILVLPGAPALPDTARPTWVVTEDPPVCAGWRALLAREERFQHAGWTHRVDVAELTDEIIRALPSGLLGRRDLPRSVRFAAHPVVAPPTGAPVAPEQTQRGAPRDPLAAAVAQLWRETLGVAPAGDAEDFFAAGGDSLSAVHLTAKLAARLGAKIAVADFVSDGTFGSLLALARTAGAATGTPSPAATSGPARDAGVIVFSETGGEPPLFFIAPGAGSSLCYRSLARRVATDRPCYGLETPGLYDGSAPMSRFEDIANHHLATIRRLYPEGPFVLAGWSVGAMVAHEIARRAGGQVPLVIGIDGQVGDAGSLRSTAETLLYEAQVRAPRLRARSGFDRFLSVDPEHAPDFGRVFLANLRALRAYRPGPAPTAAVLFATRLSAARRRRLMRRLAPWYEGAVTVLPTGGSHWTVLDEAYLDRLAAGLRAALERLSGGQGPR